MAGAIPYSGTLHTCLETNKACNGDSFLDASAAARHSTLITVPTTETDDDSVDWHVQMGKVSSLRGMGKLNVAFATVGVRCGGKTYSRHLPYAYVSHRHSYRGGTSVAGSQSTTGTDDNAGGTRSSFPAAIDLLRRELRKINEGDPEAETMIVLGMAENSFENDDLSHHIAAVIPKLKGLVAHVPSEDELLHTFDASCCEAIAHVSCHSEQGILFHVPTQHDVLNNMATEIVEDVTVSATVSVSSASGESEFAIGIPHPIISAIVVDIHTRIDPCAFCAWLIEHAVSDISVSETGSGNSGLFQVWGQAVKKAVIATNTKEKTTVVDASSPLSQELRCSSSRQYSRFKFATRKIDQPAEVGKWAVKQHSHTRVSYIHMNIPTAPSAST